MCVVALPPHCIAPVFFSSEIEREREAEPQKRHLIALCPSVHVRAPPACPQRIVLFPSGVRSDSDDRNCPSRPEPLQLSYSSSILRQCCCRCRSNISSLGFGLLQRPRPPRPRSRPYCGPCTACRAAPRRAVPLSMVLIWPIYLLLFVECGQDRRASIHPSIEDHLRWR